MPQATQDRDQHRATATIREARQAEIVAERRSGARCVICDLLDCDVPGMHGMIRDRARAAR